MGTSVSIDDMPHMPIDTTGHNITVAGVPFLTCDRMHEILNQYPMRDIDPQMLEIAQSFCGNDKPNMPFSCKMIHEIENDDVIVNYKMTVREGNMSTSRRFMKRFKKEPTESNGTLIMHGGDDPERFNINCKQCVPCTEFMDLSSKFHSNDSLKRECEM